jgi:hypothetical protein
MTKIMEKIKNNWTLILASLFLIFSIVLISQCRPPKQKQTEWRYEIHGYVIHNGKPHDAIWYTDTIEFGDNYLRYVNSDSSEVIIPSPYVLIDHKFNKIIRDSVPAF